ncbi:MAG TPA: acyltransferase [Puia sp.]|nr:acyltransferase [Puia sp.]
MKQENRIVQLDGLRGIAVLLVMAFHLLNNQYGTQDISHLNKVEKILMKSTYFGWCGVDLFFVMSGFLIGSILLRNRGGENYFSTFYIRRFFRIVPIYYILLLIFIVLTFTSFYTTEAYIFEKPLPIPYYFLFLQNFLMSSHGHFGPEALTPTWSLAVEEQFYLIMPLIVYYMRPKNLLYVILFLIVAAPVCRAFTSNWYQEYTLLTSRIDSPAFGFLLAWLLQNERTKAFIEVHIQKIKWISLPFLIISSILYATARVGVINHSILAINFTLILLITLYLRKGLLFKVLTSRVLVVTGGLSYFLYLYHQLINGMFHLAFLKQHMPMLDSRTAYGVTFLGLLVLYVLARLSYKYLEQPLIKYSHSFKVAMRGAPANQL